VKRSRLPVLAGVGSSTLADSVALAREARNAGAAALLLPPPYFYPLDQDDVREFYVQFAARLGPGIPTMLVNTPPLTAYIEPASARDLIASGHYAGLVDTDPAAASHVSTTVLSASDSTFLQARQAGASGALSELACAAPELMVAIERTMCAGDWTAAAKLNTEIQRASAWLAEFPQSAGLKAAAGMRKLKTGAEISAPLTAAKQARMEEFRRWFPEWLAHVGKLTGHA
jgi:4-hydroxy-tetrahydrodipicolinate synthase